MTLKLMIVQPYVPAYRVGFFESLRNKLLEHDIECHIAAGSPAGAQAVRGDSVYRDWITPTQRRTMRVAGHTIKWQTKPTPWKNVDGLIVGLQGSSIPVYQALVASRVEKFRVGLWGHAKPYVGPGNKIDLGLEKLQMMSADHIFTYTPSGTEYVTRLGIDSEKVTTVMNTIDTSQLERQLNSISDSDIDQFTNALDLNINRTVCFVGGLDQSKRIDFLAKSMDHLWSIDPTIKVLIGGKGQDEHFLRTAYDRRQALPLGYLNGRDKAIVLLTSRAICMPGRIGLVAVDALVSGRPILTTAWDYHAPEADYLIEGESRITARNDPIAYAEVIKKLVDSQRGTRPFFYPTIDNMIENYADGVLKMLSH